MPLGYPSGHPHPKLLISIQRLACFLIYPILRPTEHPHPNLCMPCPYDLGPAPSSIPCHIMVPRRFQAVNTPPVQTVGTRSSTCHITVTNVCHQPSYVVSATPPTRCTQCEVSVTFSSQSSTSWLSLRSIALPCHPWYAPASQFTTYVF